MEFEKWPYYDTEQINAVCNTLISGNVNYWTGTQTKQFEENFAKWCGTKYSIALANGTAALDASYKSLRLENDDEVITTPRTFIATSSSAIINGLKPIFADVDADSGNISPTSISERITKRTKAIAVVHIGGWPAEIKKILDIAKTYNLKVIEDCSQAHGAAIKINEKFKSVGSFGDVSTWSFCQDKIMTTGGEGGMITTNSSDIWEFIWSFKDHGKSYKEVHNNKNKEGFKWLHENIGSNLRLTEMQSALGNIQLERIHEWNKIRSKNASIISNKIKDLDIIRVPTIPENVRHAWYKYYCYLKPKNIKSDWSRTRIIKEINKIGFPAFEGGCGEIYLEKIFKKFALTPDIRLPVAKRLSETSLMFVVHPTISLENMEIYADSIRKVLIMASK